MGGGQARIERKGSRLDLSPRRGYAHDHEGAEIHLKNADVSHTAKCNMLLKKGLA